MAMTQPPVVLIVAWVMAIRYRERYWMAPGVDRL